MRTLKILLASAGLVCLFSALAAPQREQLAWVPLPVQPAEWTTPNKPIWRLSELLATHQGQQNWSKTVVSDNLLHADYISKVPGAKTPRQFHPDNIV
jgi:hypothetical protein